MNSIRESSEPVRIPMMRKCVRGGARARGPARGPAPHCMPRGAAADPARVYILIMYLVRGTTSVGTHRALIKQLLTLAGALLTHFTNYLTAARNLAPAGRNFPSSSVNYFVIKSKSTILLGMHGKFLIFNSEFAPSTIISLTGFFSLRQSPSLRDETSSCMVTRDLMKISPVQMNPN